MAVMTAVRKQSAYMEVAYTSDKEYGEADAVTLFVTDQSKLFSHNSAKVCYNGTVVFARHLQGEKWHNVW